MILTRIYTLSLLWLTSALPLAAQETIYVKDQTIFSSCGEPIVLRGVNEMFIWSSDHTGAAILPEIAKTGANAVRLVWTTDGDVKELDKLIGNCLALHMIPIPELHDATGDFSKFQKCLDYWKKPEVLKILQKHKKWLILNIANEVGKGETFDEWADYYKGAITQLRSVGIDLPLMIDCGDYGSNENYMLERGQTLIDHDPLHQLIFSVHTYWIQPDNNEGRKQRLENLMANAKAKNLPFIIGEGPQKAVSPWSRYCEEDFPYLHLIERCQEEGIGWLSWSWGAVNNNDCGSPNSAFDMTEDGKFGHWAADFAAQLCVSDRNSIKNTSVKPFSMLKGKCAVPCSKPDLEKNQSLCLSASVQLEAKTASITNKTYTWYRNNQVLKTKEAVLTVQEAGKYRVEVDSAGACITSDEILVNDKLDLYLGEDAVLCQQTQLELSVGTGNEAFTIRWFKNGVELKHSLPQLLVTEAGLYKATISGGTCTSASDEVNISSLLPVVENQQVCKGKTLALKVAGAGKYLWYADSEATKLLANGSLNTSPTKNTTYYVKDEGGFRTSFGKKAPGKTVMNTWGESSKEYKMRFEVTENLTIEQVDVYAGTPGTINAVLYDSQLNELATYSVKALFTGKETIVLNHQLKPGTYYISAQGSEAQVLLDHNDGPTDTQYPYTLEVGGKKIIEINGSEPAWITTRPWYLFFYNWQIKTANGSICNAKPVHVEVKECK